MTISSRTPEGEPHRCPLCIANITVEPSVFFGDGTCPNCGQLIWFLNTPDENHTFSHNGNEELRNHMLDLIAKQLGVSQGQIANDASLLSNIGADSLDTVELVLELEQEIINFDD